MVVTYGMWYDAMVHISYMLFGDLEHGSTELADLAPSQYASRSVRKGEEGEGRLEDGGWRTEGGGWVLARGRGVGRRAGAGIGCAGCLSILVTCDRIKAGVARCVCKQQRQVGGSLFPASAVFCLSTRFDYQVLRQTRRQPALQRSLIRSNSGR